MKKFFVVLFCCLFCNFSFTENMREIFIETAKSYLNTPYKFGGLSETGMDCSGLVYTSALKGIEYNTPRKVENMYSRYEKINDNQREPGDLVFFTTDDANPDRISHVGIFIGNNEFIHSMSNGNPNGVVITKLSKPYWKKRYVGAARFLPSNKSILVQQEQNKNRKKETKTSQNVGQYNDVAFLQKPTQKNTQLSAIEKRNVFIVHAKNVMGVPYKEGGTYQHGIDDIGLVYALARDLFGAFDFPSTREMLYQKASLVDEKKAEPGDILFFQKNGQLAHVGIYIGNSEFIHVSANDSRGVTIDSLKDKKWLTHYYAVGQIFEGTK